MDMRASLLTLLTLLTVALLSLTACGETCDYKSKCHKGELKFCTDDYNDGDPQTHYTSQACEAANPVCVDLDGDNARCVTSATAICDADFVQTCDGTQALRCVESHVVAEACALHGNVCVVQDGAARCARAPLTACDPQTFSEVCDGSVALLCDEGVVERLDCAVEDPHSVCRLTTAERGETAYCD